MKILVLNSGSSSLKFQLFALPGPDRIGGGLVEDIGGTRGGARFDYRDASGRDRKIRQDQPVADHGAALALMGEMLRQSRCLEQVAELAAIGHRVVHGGERFHEPVLIDARVIRAIEELSPLAPLHNPANLAGIRVAREQAPSVPQVAVFDTAFHQSMPRQAFLYGLPYALYEKFQVRRYGFHGSSHAFVSRQAAVFLGRDPGELNCISMHLGNGASVAAIRGGQCVDTSMGMTPLAGLIMGTRCGDLDPAILFYLAREAGLSIEELDRLTNRQSGLKGICGRHDMRAITEAADQGDDRAALALDMFCYRLRHYIGAYLAVLGRVDCLVFTGGIGENAPVVRERALTGLDDLGIRLDREKNLHPGPGITPIHGRDSARAVLVVPTDEELEIARQTIQVCGLGKKSRDGGSDRI